MRQSLRNKRKNEKIYRSVKLEPIDVMMQVIIFIWFGLFFPLSCSKNPSYWSTTSSTDMPYTLSPFFIVWLIGLYACFHTWFYLKRKNEKKKTNENTNTLARDLKLGDEIKRIDNVIYLGGYPNGIRAGKGYISVYKEAFILIVHNHTYQTVVHYSTIQGFETEYSNINIRLKLAKFYGKVKKEYECILRLNSANVEQIQQCITQDQTYNKA